MTHRDEHLELVAAHALGALDDAERRELDAHLAEGCAICEAERRTLRAVADALALAVGPVQPPAAVKDRLLGRIAAERRTAPARPRWLPVALAASLLLALGLGARVWMLDQALRIERRTSASVATRLAAAERRAAEVQASLAQAKGAIGLLTGPDVHTVSLAGQADAPKAHARAFLDPSRGSLLLYVYDLPPPPAGKTYQLWVILGGTPISAGTFGVPENGRTSYQAPSVPTFDGEVTVAVTIEPAGGVPSPTGPMVLAGS